MATRSQKQLVNTGVKNGKFAPSVFFSTPFPNFHVAGLHTISASDPCMRMGLNGKQKASLCADIHAHTRFLWFGGSRSARNSGWSSYWSTNTRTYPSSLPDAKFCVYSKSAIKIVRTSHNHELCAQMGNLCQRAQAQLGIPTQQKLAEFAKRCSKSAWKFNARPQLGNWVRIGRVMRHLQIKWRNIN